MGVQPSFLILLALLLISTYPHPVKPKPHNNNTDLAALISFKDHVVDPYNILSSNWTLNTSFCSWIGVTCSNRHQRVAVLELQSFPLEGTISPQLGNLSFLSSLVLSNNSLSGSIPDTLGNLYRLQQLVLENNYFSGHIPFSLFNMSSLINIYLSSNNISGSLPSNHSLFMLPNLHIFAISQNQFIGQIPSFFGLCLNLQQLDLSFNNFTGTIPHEFGYLMNLGVLNLAYNHLTGTIPTSLGNLTMVYKLYLSRNNLEGEIPHELGNLSNLKDLLLSRNSLTGSIPMSLLNVSMIANLDLAANNLTGYVPDTLGHSMPLLSKLFIESNQLTGSLDFITSLTNCKNLTYLSVAENVLSGSLPNSIGNLTVKYLSMYSNHISGSIPTGLCNLSNLYSLDLGINELTGLIPSEINRLQGLQDLYLNRNKLTGSIPFDLGQMSRLSTVHFARNRLNGKIPNSIGNITGLYELSFGSNNLSSSIPRSLWSLQGLIELYLSKNFLTGSLSEEVSNLKNLDVLDLHQNLLSGNISSGLGMLSMITYLDLSSNYFTGQLPQSLGGLINVQYLNFSKNSLSGVIPKSIGNLHYLDSLDLSFNKLEGKIPEGRVFSNPSIASLEGNVALCGASLLHFPPCSTNTVDSHWRRNIHLLKYIIPPVAFVVVVSCLFVIFASQRRRKPRTMAHTDIPQELGDHRFVSYNELVRATNNFSHENLIGKGSFGSVYKGKLDDGVIVAVKVLNLDVEGASKSFEAECKALCTIRHRNLIKIISVCFNLDFQALILPLMSNGNLEQWLYSENCCLSLLQRLNIMLDVSLALEYMHHHHPHVVLHCDLKPSNILLDEEMVAHVSDFGIAKLLLGDSKSIISASTPGTIGYIAPEYGLTGKVTKMSDVYSFGVLLLETFTKKKPTDVSDGELNIRETMCKEYPTTLLDSVDYNLLNHGAHSQQSENSTAMYQCISSIIELGLLCSRDSPKERLQMIEVVPRLQNIKVQYLTQISSA